MLNMLQNTNPGLDIAVSIQKKNFPKIILIVLLYSIIANSIAQPTKTDSLKLLIHHCDKNTNQYTDLLNEIAYSFYSENHDSCMFYANEAKQCAEKNDYLLGIAWAHVHLGQACFKKSDNTNSYANLNKALAIFTEAKNSKGLAATYNLLGVVPYLQADYKKALFYFEKAAAENTRNNDKIGLAKVYNNMGVINKKLGNFNRALDYYQLALNIEKDLGYKLGVSQLYNNIAIIYRHLDDFDSAIDYYNKAFAIKSELGIKNDMAKLSNNIGILYLTNKKPLKAYEYFKRSIKLKEDIGDCSLPASYSSLGNCFISLEKYDSAFYFLNKTIEITGKNHRNIDWANANCSLGLLYWKLNDFEKSIHFSEMAYSVGKETGNVALLLESSEVLAKSNKELKNYKDALSYFQEYHNLTEKISSDNVIRKFAAFKYGQEKLIIEHELTKQNILVEQKQKQVWFSFIIMVLILAAGLIGLFDYLKMKKKNKMLFNKNLELTSVEQSAEDYEIEEFARKTNASNKILTADLQLLENLNRLLQKEKCYTNKTLTLDNLAEILNTNRSYLSRQINEHYNCNFNRLINKYRIKEARVILIKPEYQNYTIEGIAKQVGFNSKSAFNIAFKEFTGITPSYYKNEAMFINK